MTFHSRDVFSYQQLPRSGTRYALIFEWALAARWWGIDWAQFNEYDGDEMAFLIAVYRTRRQIEAVEAWWQTRRQRRK